MRSFSVVAVYVVHYGDDYLEYSIRSVYDYVDKILISVGLNSWGYKSTLEIDPAFLAKVNELPIRYPKVELVYGRWEKDEDQRNDTLQHTRDYDYYFLVDSDEIYRQKDIENLYSVVESNLGVGAFRINFLNFWRSFGYVIQEEIGEPVQRFFKNSQRRFYFKRSCTSGYRRKAQYDIALKYISCYHFSYARSYSAIRYKFNTWMHSVEVHQDWLDKVFFSWPHNRSMKNLFPVIGQESRWIRAVPFDRNSLPEVLTEHPYYTQDVIC